MITLVETNLCIGLYIRVWRSTFPTVLLFMNETCFKWKGIFNSQKSHVWVEANPRAASVHCHQQHFAVNVWAGIGPTCFPDSSVHRLTGCFWRKSYQKCWRISHMALRRNVVKAWRGCGSLCTSPPWSLDLTPVDFFLWGHIKALRYMSLVIPKRILLPFSLRQQQPGIFKHTHQSLLRVGIDGHIFELRKVWAWNFSTLRIFHITYHCCVFGENQSSVWTWCKGGFILKWHVPKVNPLHTF